jgi:hypothetical protein
MKTHQEIDRRSLKLAEAVVRKLEAGDIAAGVARARAVNARWRADAPTLLHRRWSEVLEREWPAIRAVLLDPSEEGARLRQNNPFCGILTPQERWAFFREYRDDAT